MVSRRPLFTFAQDPASLPSIQDAAALVGVSNADIDREFERSFAAAAGGGRALSYASGRMAFHAYLVAIGMQPGDEVILPGFTCSVMVNAILRLGAVPRFCDIGAGTLGTDPVSVRGLIGSRTKLIVAQHSFGYACDIESILDVAEAAGIPVLEDCATSLGTSVSGRPVGTFGHASIFSTDHTKPVNTLIGGLLLSSDDALMDHVTLARERVEHLPPGKQRAIHRRLALESQLSHPDTQWRLGFADIVSMARARTLPTTTPYLDEDYGISAGDSTYPYPARLPSFLAAVGLEQLSRWRHTALIRKEVGRALIEAVRLTKSGVHLPAVVDDPRQDIVPLRIAWSEPFGAEVRERLHPFVATEGTWFMKPVVTSPFEPEDFGFIPGSCPTAETAGAGMVNLPVPSNSEEAARLLALVASALG